MVTANNSKNTRNSNTAKKSYTTIRVGNDHGSINFGHISQKADVTSDVLLQASDSRHSIALDKNGVRKAPTPYELKGGPTWYDMGKCQVTVHRIDGTANEVDIIVTKAKPESVASVGPTRMVFDKKIRRFYWDYNGQNTYAKKEYFKPTGISLSEDMEGDDEEMPF